MTDLTNFDDTSDVSDAAIEWVVRAVRGTDSAETTRMGAGDFHNCPLATARLLAARLIQQHRPDLLVDPVDAIVREELAKAYEEAGLQCLADNMRAGRYGEDEEFTAAKRLYLKGIEEGRKSRD